MTKLSVTVACSVAIPIFVSFCIAFLFFLKTRKRLRREDDDFQKNLDVENINQDLSYDDLDGLRMNHLDKESIHQTLAETSETSTEDGKYQEKSNKKGRSDSKSRKPTYTPAYKKNFKSSVTNLNNSRNSSFSNLNQHIPGASHPLGSNSSIESSNTNPTDFLYSNVVPVLGTNDSVQTKSSRNSFDLARSLQQPTPSYQKKNVSSRSPSGSTLYTDNQQKLDNNDYDLKNNYNVDNENEIQEEDQYENEFTNYTESKREYINSLRPKN